MLETFASSAKFHDEKIGQMVFNLLLKRKYYEVFLNPNISKNFALKHFNKAPNAMRIHLAKLKYSPEELEQVLKTEKSIKVINEILSNNVVTEESANKLLETYGDKILPGVYNSLKGEFNYFLPKIKLLKGEQLISFIFVNRDKIELTLIQEILGESAKYFSPNSRVNIMLSALLDFKPELIEALLSSKDLTIFDSTLASHYALSVEELSRLLDKLLKTESKDREYALMAMASSPKSSKSILEKINLSTISLDIKSLVNKNIKNQDNPNFDLNEAVLNRSLPSKFKREGRIGNLLSLYKDEEVNAKIKTSALEVLKESYSTFPIVFREYGINVPSVSNVQSDEGRGLLNTNLERYLESPARYLTTYYILDELSLHLEKQFQEVENYWENFFTLSSTFEGSLAELIETSKKL
jgi:hypothetical protein